MPLRSRHALPIAGWLLAAGLLASCTFIPDDDGCEGIACGAADPPLEIVVADVVDATVIVSRQDGAAVDTSCVSEADGTLCHSWAGPGDPQAGVYAVHAEAPDRQVVSLEIVVAATPPGGCCNSGYVAESVTIDLPPE